MTDAVGRLNAALSGRYSLERELGEGGMATVYLAHDVRHDRKVALKVLKPELAAVVGAERFLGEIRTTANLQHPHILPLFDSGEADGFLFFVMPYVEGESLRDRLEREKQLPVQDAIRIAIEVADALEHAHRHGVIHRDIKPGNILLRDGHVQVADFGIALAVQEAGGSRITETGLSVGTPHYMSPEQSTGDRVLDGRSDVYALGSVLYEMLAGEPPHTGPTAQSVLAKILTEEPTPLSRRRSTVPAQVGAAVEIALQKLPADRFATAAEFRAALKGDTPLATARPATGGGRSGFPSHGAERLPWGIAGIAVIMALWVSTRSPAPGPAEVRHLNIALPDSAPLVFVGEAGPPGETALTLSSDGSRLAYVGPADSTTRLYVRDLSSGSTRGLPGTEGAFAPFFSPDGDWVGFFSGGQMKRVSIDGERVIPITEVHITVGAAWGPDGRIAVVYDDGTRLGLVSLADGTLTPLQVTGWSDRFAQPSWLPGGEWLLMYCRGPIHLCVTSPETGEVRHLTTGGPAVGAGDTTSTWLAGTSPRFIPPDLLVFSTVAENVVMGARFDPERLEVLSAPFPLLDGIRREDSIGQLQLAVSATGDVVYARGVNRGAGRFAWVDPEGATEVLPFPERLYGWFQLSSDGRFVVVGVSPPTGEGELWLIDLDRPGEERRWMPASLPPNSSVSPGPWDPASRSFLLTALGGGRRHIVSANPLRMGGEEVLWSGTAAMRVVDVNAESTAVLGAFSRERQIEALGTLALQDLSGIPPEGPVDFDTLGYGFGPLSSISPDGEWLTYTSDANGPFEIYAKRVGSEDPPFRVSSAAGEGQLARWAPDGSGFWYRSGRRFYWVARTDLEDQPFAAPVPGPSGDFLQVGGPEMEISPDGRRLLVLLGAGRESTTTLEIITNWRDEAERLMGGSRE
jgi:serine/threonine-protein kinase